MNQKLRTLFDFQRFEKNPNLNRVIDDVESRYGLGQVSSIRKLSDDELDMVIAAGIPHLEQIKKGDPGENGQ